MVCSEDVSHLYSMDAAAPRIDGNRFLDEVLLRMLNDPRDLPFVYLSLQCSVVALMGVGLYFVSGTVFWWCALAYGLVWGLGVVDRFILMLHCTSHRILFNKRFGYLNRYIPWILGPFFGESPDGYFVHHLGMHHPENNLEADLSSTMKYQRDRLDHWLRYLVRFVLLIIVELPLYHWRKGHAKLAARAVVGEGGLWLLILGLMFVDVRATVVVFVIPLLLVRVLMMAGNWAQHAFIDPHDPANPYRNSITCINTRYNRRCFNDGYHIHHHVKARCHWSEYPEEYLSNRETYGAQDAIVFERIDFFQVWFLLMTRQYRVLARHFVQLPGAPERSQQEIAMLFHRRLAPCARARV